MKLWIKWALAVAGISSVAGTALAGMKSTETVVVNPTTRFAQFSIGGTRNTTDSVAFGGCYLDGIAGSSTEGGCEAKNAAGTYVSCYTTDASLRAVIASVNGDSSVEFYYNASGICTEIFVGNDSVWTPKVL